MDIFSRKMAFSLLAKMDIPQAALVLLILRVYLPLEIPFHGTILMQKVNSMQSLYIIMLPSAKKGGYHEHHQD